MDVKRIRLTDLPHPWQLTEDWMERLEVPEHLRQEYFRLSEPQRMKLEAERLLKENSAAGFKKALEVLENYALYRSWVETIPRNSTLLHLIMPYWMKDEAPFYTYNIWPGFFRLKIDAYRPSIGTLKDLAWDAVVFELEELDVDTTKLMHPESGFYLPEAKKIFGENPFQCLHPNEYRRSFTWKFNEAGEFKPVGALGFVALFGERIRSIIEWGDKWSQLTLSPHHSPSIGDSLLRLELHSPQAEHLQKLLNLLARRHFEERTPKDDWQMQFDVAGDLSAITVASIAIKPSRFGYFYDERKEPLNT